MAKVWAKMTQKYRDYIVEYKVNLIKEKTDH